jgi:tetratricopeptide (TPR) repeat protein
VPSLLAAAVLSLAQICLSAGSAEEALAWLADPKIGAKTLVDAGDPVADEDDFALETYQAALSAYVAGRQIEKAQHAMQTMEELVQQSGQPDANQRLVQVYIRLGRELECQVGRLRGQGRSERLAKLVAAFEAFAAQTARPREGSGFFALDAAAEMRLGIAAGLDAWGLPPPEEARKYYRRAAAAYRGLLERCRADGSFTPRPEAVTAATIRLARCLRRLGEGREALDLLAPILRKHKALVDAQVEAAYTYQDWARQKPECYQSAVEGSPEHPEVWGWQELCRRLESSAKYQDTFYEARYNLGLCRFEQAQAQADGQRQAELLEAAARELRDAKQLSTKPGGSAWHDQYDDLLRRIQKRGNQTPAGRPTPADKN